MPKKPYSETKRGKEAFFRKTMKMFRAMWKLEDEIWQIQHKGLMKAIEADIAKRRGEQHGKETV